MERLKRILPILDGVAAVSMTVAALALLWWLVSGRVGAPQMELVGAAREAPAGAAEDVEALRLTVAPSSDSPASASGARVAIIEFADFECPFCEKYAHETLPRLRADFVEPRKVIYLFKHFPLDMHPQARAAAQMAVCAAAQAKFWEMHALLFGSPRNLAPHALTGYARGLRLDNSKLQTCLSESAARIDRDEAEGKRLGVTSTPTFLFGEIAKDGSISVRRRIMGAYGYEAFRAAIQGLLDASPVRAGN